jgi:integrase
LNFLDQLGLLQQVERQAGLKYRQYDARHTFVTRLAENPSVSEETIRQLAGHVSPKMLSRYAHIRAQARRNAIATLEQAQTVEPLLQPVKQMDTDGRLPN